MEGGVEGGPGSPDYTVIMYLVSEGPNPPVVNVRGLYNYRWGVMVFKIILFNLLNGIVDYYVNLSMTEEIQYRRIIIKNILIFIFYYLWDLFYLLNGMMD